MEHKHTPGPWLVNTAGSGQNNTIVIDEIYVYAPGPNDDVSVAADIVNPETGEPSMANARLIAAAPDLLEALRGLDDAYCRAGTGLSREERNEDRLRLIAARAAIAKATGT